MARRGLSRTGAPLDTEIRTELEASFGRSLHDVRIHTDGTADSATRALSTRAYTVGSDIAVRQGLYPPRDRSALATLGHEVAHTIQQAGASDGALSQIPSGSEAESHADAAADAVVSGERAPQGPSTGRAIARDGAEPLPAEAEAPLEERDPDAEGGPIRFRAPPAVDRGSSTDWGAAADWNAARDYAIYRQGQLERPYMVTEPGGAPPDFITQGPPSSSLEQEGQFSYTPQYFHVLDAIRYDVALARTPAELYGLFRFYFADLLTPTPASLTPTLPPGSAASIVLYFERSGDPHGAARIAAFAEAYGPRSAAVPALQHVSIPGITTAAWADLYAAIAQELEPAFIKQRTSGPCDEEDVPRKGENAAHDKFADQVTGGTQDLKIKTPEGVECVTDGRDEHNPRLVWEVKTRHEWATDEALPSTYNWPAFDSRIKKIERQRAMCLVVTARCGLAYHYAFDNQEVARAFGLHWEHVPPCLYRELNYP